MKKKLKNSISKLDKLLIVLLIMTVITIATVIVANFAVNMIANIISLILCFIEFIALSLVLLFLISNMTKSMIDDYANRKNLFSGALCVVLLSVTSYLLFKGIGDTIYKDEVNNFDNIANTIITLTPALLSLLGVHYSNMMQEAHRKEDFRISNIPCPSIECIVERIHEATVKQNGVYIKLRISNLADNILIPLYVCDIDLEYAPVTNSTNREYKNIHISYNDYSNKQITLLYQDASETLYITKLIVPEDTHDDYVVIKNTKPKILTTETKLLKENKKDIEDIAHCYEDLIHDSIE